MTDKITLDLINRMTDSQFIDLLGGIYEHSPWVAKGIISQRPFASVTSLRDGMSAAVKQSDRQRRLTLIRNHPQLAGKEADQGTLTEDSKMEQSSAGLDQCSSDELRTIQSLNHSYLDKFEFPFVIAVRGLNKQQIIAAMQRRLNNDRQTEFETSIEEIIKIAEIRLDSLIHE